MAAGIRLDADTALLRRRVADMAAVLEKDPQVAFDEVGQILVTSTVLRFKRGVGPDGEPWPKSRRAEREGGKTLVDKARLRNSITHVASADGVDVGTNVVYAAVHQFGAEAGEFGFFSDGRRGTPIPWGDIPARPFLGLDDDDADAVVGVFRRRLAGAAT
ncbi:MAG: phage virion morphogenesis protein [Gemmatimonadetes bacterium]|nr:phage virion morphogenesis protein [Gemmatimonadota bacterium]